MNGNSGGTWKVMSPWIYCRPVPCNGYFLYSGVSCMHIWFLFRVVVNEICRIVELVSEPQKCE